MDVAICQYLLSRSRLHPWTGFFIKFKKFFDTFIYPKSNGKMWCCGLGGSITRDPVFGSTLKSLKNVKLEKLVGHIANLQI